MKCFYCNTKIKKNFFRSNKSKLNGLCQKCKILNRITRCETITDERLIDVRKQARNLKRVIHLLNYEEYKYIRDEIIKLSKLRSREMFLEKSKKESKELEKIKKTLKKRFWIKE